MHGHISFKNRPRCYTKLHMCLSLLEVRSWRKFLLQEFSLRRHKGILQLYIRIYFHSKVSDTWTVMQSTFNSITWLYNFVGYNSGMQLLVVIAPLVCSRLYSRTTCNVEWIVKVQSLSALAHNRFRHYAVIKINSDCSTEYTVVLPTSKISSSNTMGAKGNQCQEAKM